MKPNEELKAFGKAGKKTKLKATKLPRPKPEKSQAPLEPTAPAKAPNASVAASAGQLALASVDPLVRSVDEKAPFTEAEVKFLDLYLLGGNSQEQALLLTMPEACAGASTWDLRIMATNILKKYERSAGEVAKIFSDIGLGQAVIAMKIKDLIDTATSDTVRLNALALAAKCVGMAREVEVQPQRISIILNVGQGGPKPDPAAGRPALAYQGKMGVPGKPLAITK